MDALLYAVVRALVFMIQAMPLTWVARLGRAAGMLAYWIDGRHRRVSLQNLHLCFGKEMSPREIRRLARENFRRIGENFCCAARTAAMSPEQLRPHLEFAGDRGILRPPPGQIPASVVVAIGHFGNFELYARLGQVCSEYQCATTYRGLRQPALNRLMLLLRERSGCLFFERRTDAAALREALNRPGLLLGLLADQNAGRRGLRLSFLGHECSTSAAPALLALRYRCRLHTAICYRVAPAKWRIEVEPEIPLHENGAARTANSIMSDVNRRFEAAVRRDPANWFWVHNRWKPQKPPREKLRRDVGLKRTQPESPP
jgi:KDO2-lipid IV(A) lauroyltransferase